MRLYCDEFMTKERDMKERSALLSAAEPPAFCYVPGPAETRMLVVCDHASNRIPESLGMLGINASRLQEHIAYDIGALAVAMGIAQRFGAGLVYGCYSRLVIDLNRGTRDRSGMPEISDGVLIPGNLALSEADQAARIATLHAPYHLEIERILLAQIERGSFPVVLAIHSFTPFVSGIPRPWHAGVLWDKDARFAVPLLDSIRADQDILVGDNEPYSGRHIADYTLDRHAEENGLAHAAIEIRQDLISEPATQQHWVKRLGDALDSVLGNQSLYAQVSGTSVVVR